MQYEPLVWSGAVIWCSGQAQHVGASGALALLVLHCVEQLKLKISCAMLQVERGILFLFARGITEDMDNPAA